MTELTRRARSRELPRHVAIIMDGNGRWAEERHLSRVEGHRRGATVVRDITVYARELGLSYLTLYSFSCQNWRRSPLEVGSLMALLEDYCRDEEKTLMDNAIRLTTIGDRARLPASTRRALERVMRATEHNDGMTLCLAVDYGGREEIVAAAQKLAQLAAAGQLRAEDIDEQAVAQHLHTGAMPDPDLLVRSSGERRISNFLLWQLAYTELHFTQVRWPDFTRAHFDDALEDFAGRQRRFGHAAAPGGGEPARALLPSARQERLSAPSESQRVGRC